MISPYLVLSPPHPSSHLFLLLSYHHCLDLSVPFTPCVIGFSYCCSPPSSLLLLLPFSSPFRQILFLLSMLSCFARKSSCHNHHHHVCSSLSLCSLINISETGQMFIVKPPAALVNASCLECGGQWALWEEKRKLFFFFLFINLHIGAIIWEVAPLILDDR